MISSFCQSQQQHCLMRQLNLVSSPGPNVYSQMYSSPYYGKAPPKLYSDGLYSNGEVKLSSSSDLNNINQSVAENSDLMYSTTDSEKEKSYQYDSKNNSLIKQHSPNLDVSPHQQTISPKYCKDEEEIDVKEIQKFAKAFKLKRISLGMTQAQVGGSLRFTNGSSFSQSTICRLEKLHITPRNAQKIKPILEKWINDKEGRRLNDYRNKNKQNNLVTCIETLKIKKKKRTLFTSEALKCLNIYFKKDNHPSGEMITNLSNELGYRREVIQIWFCNKRQALKNTQHMISNDKPS
uniref:POU domain protein n=1 Tax=Clastoptera arizonana TaxID=38151 RepID=A0A1B6CCM0_9HEMI